MGQLPLWMRPPPEGLSALFKMPEVLKGDPSLPPKEPHKVHVRSCDEEPVVDRWWTGGDSAGAPDEDDWRRMLWNWEDDGPRSAELKRPPPEVRELGLKRPPKCGVEEAPEVRS
ncbi:hypothetical protein Hamer_G011468 [Homarus americanus]|uniref:Uncharacterized protein n=1 Tax=Homarus americanus TaxID=6706 RepID=A0A8J5JI44_HOMAM|nr:hypothetical protein Hamer_G011468 [Homarus americanus]